MLNFSVKIYLCFLLFVSCFLIKAQTNLVPNPSFEDTVACPNGSDNINDATGWYTASSDPDLFNPCANIYGFGTPKNAFGYQVAYNGVAYAGVVTYSKVYKYIRECMSVQLTQPLAVGTKYYVSAYISLADSSYCDCATNKFGFKFSTILYNLPSTPPVPIDNFSHVHSDSIIKDKINWTKIAGSFIADSIYKCLNIGNFYDSSHTDTLPCTARANFYYVDMVCVSTDSNTCNHPLGISAVKNNFSGIYPNPANNLLNIKNLAGKTFLIYNAMGVIIAKGKINGIDYQIDVSLFIDGLYAIEVDDKYYYKFLISH
jgi:hypothetical protein